MVYDRRSVVGGQFIEVMAYSEKAVSFGLMLSLINQFVYRPDAAFAPPDFSPANLGLAFEEVAVETADGLTLSGWYLPAWNATHALMYCHGNAGSIHDWVEATPNFVEDRVSVLIWDYRGYGRSEGEPSEEGLYLDGRAMWAWLKERAAQEGVPASILGKSLGSAVAIQIGIEDRPTSLILDSAFTSMREIVGLHAYWAPQAMIPKLYESLEKVPAITSPTLLLHGGQDQLVPLSQGESLFEAITAPKSMRVFPSAGHNDISSYPKYHEVILRFLADPAGYTDDQLTII